MNLTPRAFALAVDDDAGHPLVRVTGEVDFATAPELKSRLLELANGGAQSITVDLAETDFIDSTGLHALFVAVRALRDRGGDLTVRSPSKSAVRILELSGFDTVVNVV